MSLWRRTVMRLLFPFWLLQRGMTLGVRAIIVDREGRVFLVRHTYVPGWYLPGGGVEVGETMADALIKELGEEANIQLSEEPKLVGIYLNIKHSRRDHVGLYLCHQWQQNGLPKPNMEVAESEFFALDDLPETTTDGTRARLAEVLQGGKKSAFWN